MRWFRREEPPQGGGYIEETIVYYDPALVRWAVLRDLLNGKDVQPDDPRLWAFGDSYWAGGGYEPPRQEERPYAGNQGYRIPVDDDPFNFDPFRDAEDPFDFDPLRDAENLFDYDPLSEMQAELDAMFYEYDRMMDSMDDILRGPTIPPHARIIYHGVRYVNDQG